MGNGEGAGLPHRRLTRLHFEPVSRWPGTRCSGTVLLALSERFGVQSEAGLLIDLKLTNDDLAAIAGVSRQFANATLQELRKRGLIAAHRRPPRRVGARLPGISTRSAPLWERGFMLQ